MRPRRTVRWVLPSLLLLVAAALIYGWFVGFDEVLPVDSPVALLSLVLVVLVLGLAVVLVRNLVRLIVDRKKGLLGSRLRSKLVFFFLALVLLPSIVLFYGSAQVINQTVEAILRTPLEELSRESGEIVDEWRGYFQNQSLGTGGRIVEEIETGALLQGRSRDDMTRLLERFRRQHELQVVQVNRGSEVLAYALPPDLPADHGAQVQAHVEELVESAARGKPLSRISRLSSGLLAHASLPLQTAGGPSVLSVGVALPPRLAQDLDGFARAEQNYAGFRAQRRDLVRLYVTLIGLIFVVTLFVATWVGFYLSRRITEPIQDLAAATREISSGNLNVRVQASIGDELGMLVDAFNEMAAELQESREVITRSTADLRRSNRALDDRRRYIETLLANLSTAVISMDTSGRATTANPAVTQVLGIELEVGQDVREALVRADLVPLDDLLALTRGGEEEAVSRDLALTREGETIQVAAYASPLRSGSGDLVGTLLIVEDLTDLLRAQRAAAWREVARRIAHEIKNPLTPIQLAAQRMRKKFSEGSDLDRVLPEATDSIEREVAALKHLVDEFSSFARMPEIAPRLVAFGDVVASVLALYKGLTGIQWEVDVHSDIGRSLMDPQQMRRVLINLIDNAVAAMNGQGAIRIGAQVAANDLIRIEVADSGPGIPPSDRDKMFAPYFSTKGRGTGLGLAIVHKVVTDHRGTIRVEDNEPHGARFVIEIPA